jgi:hypothetical protein
MTGCIHGRNEVEVGGPVAHVVIDVAGSGYAGCDRLVSPVGLAAIDVVAHHGQTWLGGRGIPMEENTMRFPVCRTPEEHHADDPEQEDRQNRNR